MTRPSGQAGELLAGLRELGAEAVSCPTIRIVDPPDAAPLRRAVERLEGFDWVVFTSVNGVTRLFEEVERARGDQRFPDRVLTAAIGPATAEALLRRGLKPHVVPEEYVAEAVAEALIGVDGLAGARVLLPRAGGARKVLPERLRAAGADVVEVIAYESRPDLEGIACLRAMIEGAGVDMITFTSASTVRTFAAVSGPDVGVARVAVIGPVTAEAARSVGIRVDAEARDYDVQGLLRAISDYYTDREAASDA